MDYCKDEKGKEACSIRDVVFSDGVRKPLPVNKNKKACVVFEPLKK